MNRQLFTNNAASQLSGSLPQGGVTLVCSAGHGSRFPTPTDGDFYYLTLFTKDAYAIEQSIEIVKVVARVGDVMTVVRDIENITQQVGGFSYNGSVSTVYMEIRWTAGCVDNTLQRSTNLSDLIDAVEARINLGLGNVDNTSDDNKPVSIAQATDATTKANAAQAASTPIAHATNVANPHATTKAQVGLGSVDNTSDANKPVSTAQQAALNLKVSIGEQLAGFRNKLINGDMRVNQRGVASSTSYGYFTCDRMYCVRDGGGMTQQQLYGVIPYKHTLRLQRDSGNTSTANLSVYQPIEQKNTQDMQGKQVTCSAKIAGSDGAAGTTVNLMLAYQTTAADYGVSGSWAVIGGTPKALPIGTSQVLSQTFTVPANATQIMPYLTFSCIGTASSDDSRYITDWQLELGSIATPFETRPIGLELALCQRYAFRILAAAYGTSGYYYGVAGIGSMMAGLVPFPVAMRVAPTAVDNIAIGPTNCSSPLWVLNTESATLRATVTATGQYRALVQDTTFDAELR